MSDRKDITILFLTVNKVPKKWANYQKETLLDASWGCPIITISREPLDWGHNIIQDEDIGPSNVYKQMLRGAKLADTEYIGIAEDDTLYTVEHFHSKFLRPDFALYNHTCWQVSLSARVHSGEKTSLPYYCLSGILHQSQSNWPARW